MLLDVDTFTIGTEEYAPISIVGFIAEKDHYINLTPDLDETLLVHDDATLTGYKYYEGGEVVDYVKEIATLVFYVKASLWNDKVDDIVEEAENGYDIQEAVDSLRECKSLKRKCSIIEMVQAWKRRRRRWRRICNSQRNPSMIKKLKNSPKRNPVLTLKRNNRVISNIENIKIRLYREY